VHNPHEFLRRFYLLYIAPIPGIDVLQSLSRTKLDTQGVIITQVTGYYLLGGGIKGHRPEGADSDTHPAANARIMIDYFST